MTLSRMRFTVRRLMIAVAVISLFVFAWKQWFPRYRTLVFTSKGTLYRWAYDLWNPSEALGYEQVKGRLDAGGDGFHVE